MTTGYEAEFYRNVSAMLREQQVTNRLLERMAIAMEESVALIKQDMEIGTSVDDVIG